MAGSTSQKLARPQVSQAMAEDGPREIAEPQCSDAVDRFSKGSCCGHDRGHSTSRSGG